MIIFKKIPIGVIKKARFGIISIIPSVNEGGMFILFIQITTNL
jgi:hypothetical protein